MARPTAKSPVASAIERLKGAGLPAGKPWRAEDVEGRLDEVPFNELAPASDDLSYAIAMLDEGRVATLDVYFFENHGGSHLYRESLGRLAAVSRGRFDVASMRQVVARHSTPTRSAPVSSTERSIAPSTSRCRASTAGPPRRSRSNSRSTGCGPRLAAYSQMSFGSNALAGRSPSLSRSGPAPAGDFNSSTFAPASEGGLRLAFGRGLGEGGGLAELVLLALASWAWPARS
jgi:hypothetical protein